MGFVACVSDPCIFVIQGENSSRGLRDFVCRWHANWWCFGWLDHASCRWNVEFFSAQYTGQSAINSRYQSRIRDEFKTAQVSQSTCITLMIEYSIKSVQNRYTIRVWKAKLWSGVNKETQKWRIAHIGIRWGHCYMWKMKKDLILRSQCVNKVDI